MTTYTLPLAACRRSDAPRVGGKAVGLGEMIEHGLPVPAGFAITTDAYRSAVAAAGLTDQIDALLTGLAPGDDTTDVAAKIQGLFTDAMLTGELAAAVDRSYAPLGEGNAVVVARSSATSEDMAEASFAGQQDTYLWVHGTDEV